MSETLIERDVSESQRPGQQGLVPTRAVLLCLSLIVLFVAAFAIRLYGIANSPADFRVRQYHSALIARGMYFENLTDIPEWRREIASINGAAQDQVEPRILETLAVFAYRVAGHEILWLPRVFSILCWTLGGGLLFASTRRMFSVDAAFFAAAFYLLTPFGIVASRNFQPDSLMVMLILLSLWMMLRYHGQPSLSNLILVLIAAALAILVKAVAVFFLFPGFLALVTQWDGFPKNVARSSVVLFFTVSLLPAALYYGNGLFVAGFLRDNQSGSFFPGLFFSASYWIGSLRILGSVLGYTALVGALLGLIIMQPGFPRRFIIGLWIGYLVFGVIFNYHFSTHGYYHLPLIPIAALSISPLADVVMKRVAHDISSPLLRVSLVGLAATIAAVVGFRELHQSLVDRVDVYRSLTRYAPEIGEYVDHSTSTIMLSEDGGRPLMYHAEIAGSAWPASGDLRLAELRREPNLSTQERLEILNRDHKKRYFIVTDFDEFQSQTHLRDYLYSHYSILVETSDYIVFDLQDEPDD